MERPRNWNEEKIKQICNDLMKMEKYNATLSKNVSRFVIKWQNIQCQ